MNKEIKQKRRDKKCNFYKHGKGSTRLFNIFQGIKKRCLNITDTHYNLYGERGIKICDEWLDKENGFMNFYSWAISSGYKDNLTIDRINVNGNYEPSNCRWVTLAENNRNKPHVKYITYNGKTQTIGQWTKELGLGKETIRERLKRGWTETEALTGR